MGALITSLVSSITASQTTGIQVRANPATLSPMRMPGGEIIGYNAYTGSGPWTLAKVVRGLEGTAPAAYPAGTNCLLGFVDSNQDGALFVDFAGGSSAPWIAESGGTLTGQLTGPSGNTFDDGYGNLTIQGSLEMTGGNNGTMPILDAHEFGLQLALNGQYLTVDSGTMLDNGNGVMYPSSAFYYPGGSGPLADSSGQLYFMNGETFADSSGNIYYSNGTIMADADGGLYGVGVHLTNIPSSAINGIQNGSNASSFVLGEFASTTLAVGSAVSLTSGTAKTVTSISLSAGDWDVTGVVDFHPGSTTTTTYFQGGISTNNNGLGSQDSYFSDPYAIATTSVDISEAVPVVRISITAVTTVYLVAKAGFGTSTLSAYGTIRARRVR